MNDIIEKYRGNYIAKMRKVVGHAPLRTIGCGVIIENDKGEILLQRRRDNGVWWRLLPCRSTDSSSIRLGLS